MWGPHFRDQLGPVTSPQGTVEQEPTRLGWGEKRYEVGGNHVGRKEARPPGGPLLRGGWGTKACTGRYGCELRVSVGVCAQKRLAVLVSPSHLHLLPPPPSLPSRRRKEAWEIFGWIFPTCLPPLPAKTLSRLGWGTGGAEGVLAEWAPLGVWRADTFSGNRRVGPAPAPAQAAFPPPPQPPGWSHCTSRAKLQSLGGGWG